MELKDFSSDVERKSSAEITREYNYGSVQLILDNDEFTLQHLGGRHKGAEGRYSLSSLGSVKLFIQQPKRMWFILSFIWFLVGLFSIASAGIVFIGVGVFAFFQGIGRIDMQIWMSGDTYCKHRHVLKRRYDGTPLNVEDGLVEFIVAVNSRLGSRLVPATIKAKDIDPTEEYLISREQKQKHSVANNSPQRAGES